MRNICRKLVVLLLSILLISTVKLHAQETWKEVKLSSFNALEAGQHILLHPDFFVAADKIKSSVASDEVHTAFYISKEPKSTYLFTFLAAGNPMKWAFKVLDETHAEWYELSCDCNIGLESSIFSNNRNPYSKLIATLTLNTRGEIEVVYSENFRKDFLNKSAFANKFFLDTYKVYQKVQK